MRKQERQAFACPVNSGTPENLKIEPNTIRKLLDEMKQLYEKRDWFEDILKILDED